MAAKLRFSFIGQMSGGGARRFLLSTRKREQGGRWHFVSKSERMPPHTPDSIKRWRLICRDSEVGIILGLQMINSSIIGKQEATQAGSDNGMEKLVASLLSTTASA
jgi:hypothetical protein